MRDQQTVQCGAGGRNWPGKTLCLAWLAGISLLTAACGHGEPPPTAASQPAGQVYQVRGILERLPAPEAGARSVMIHHEAIDDFVDNFGETVGMNAMTMPFTLGPGVDLKDLRVGDKVAFRLEVNWGANRMVITQMSKLPADTPLEFRKARKAAESSPATAARERPREL